MQHKQSLLSQAEDSISVRSRSKKKYFVVGIFLASVLGVTYYVNQKGNTVEIKQRANLQNAKDDLITLQFAGGPTNTAYAEAFAGGLGDDPAAVGGETLSGGVTGGEASLGPQVGATSASPGPAGTATGDATNDTYLEAMTAGGSGGTGSTPLGGDFASGYMGGVGGGGMQSTGGGPAAAWWPGASNTAAPPTAPSAESPSAAVPSEPEPQSEAPQNAASEEEDEDPQEAEVEREREAQEEAAGPTYEQGYDDGYGDGYLDGFSDGYAQTGGPALRQTAASVTSTQDEEAPEDPQNEDALDQ